MKALGVFIFGGSATFGVEASGYKVDRILEMTEDMKELNAKHFAKNRPDIPIILPSEWENSNYLMSLKNEDYDLLYSNCPCSSLSQINRNASVDGANNAQFYRVFKVISTVQPKAFFIENAPTLVKLGYPILQDMIKQLEDVYKFTIIRDYGGNHGIAMKRMRTLVVGWRKDAFNHKIPLLEMKQLKKTTAKQVIGDLYEYPVGDLRINNHTLIKNDKSWTEVEHLFGFVKPKQSTLLAFIEHWNEVDSLLENKECRDEVLKRKADLEAGHRIWDKTPFRVSENDVCPSMTSVTRIIHPIHNRTFTIREYARLMGYPDDFVFYPEESKVDVIQAISQGVPAPLVKYITTEIKESLEGNRPLIENSSDKIVSFQHHTHKVWKTFTSAEIAEMKELDHNSKDKTFKELDK